MRNLELQVKLNPTVRYMIPSYPTVNDSASGLLTVGFNSTCNSRFPILLLNCGSYFCFTSVGCLPPILPLSGGSYFCFTFGGCSRDFNYVCNPNYGCSCLPECIGQMSKHPCNNSQQQTPFPVCDSSSPYICVASMCCTLVGNNYHCTFLIPELQAICIKHDKLHHELEDLSQDPLILCLDSTELSPAHVQSAAPPAST